MKIYSSNKQHYFEIIEKEIDGISFFEVSAKLDSFSGINTSVHLDNLSSFVLELDTFILDRTISPTLTGTYDFKLEFFIKSEGGKPRLKIRIGNVFCDSPGNSSFGIYGEFEIDSEYLTSYLEFFRELV